MQNIPQRPMILFSYPKHSSYSHGFLNPVDWPGPHSLWDLGFAFKQRLNCIRSSTLSTFLDGLMVTFSVSHSRDPGFDPSPGRHHFFFFILPFIIHNYHHYWGRTIIFYDIVIQENVSYSFSLSSTCESPEYDSGSLMSFTLTVLTERGVVPGPMVIETPIPPVLNSSNLKFESIKVTYRGSNVVCLQMGTLKATLFDRYVLLCWTLWWIGGWVGVFVFGVYACVRVCVRVCLCVRAYLWIGLCVGMCVRVCTH